MALLLASARAECEMFLLTDSGSNTGNFTRAIRHCILNNLYKIRAGFLKVRGTQQFLIAVTFKRHKDALQP